MNSTDCHTHGTRTLTEIPRFELRNVSNQASLTLPCVAGRVHHSYKDSCWLDDTPPRICNLQTHKPKVGEERIWGREIPVLHGAITLHSSTLDKPGVLHDI